jgi:isoquinoline 1-oxidoreductase beta subunit
VAARKDGDATGALKKAAKTFEAVYDLPYLAHATMEPINCVADVRADHCEVWVGTQMQTADRAAAAEESGLKPEQVTLHTTLLGGGFGRRAAIDNHFVREAVQISKAVRAPVKVIWTREDDMQGGYYRPRAYHSVRARLDAAGRRLRRTHTSSDLSSLAACAGMIRTASMSWPSKGQGHPYAIRNVRVDAPRGRRTDVFLQWRRLSCIRAPGVCRQGTLIDELATPGQRSVEFRRGLLDDKSTRRRRRVLELSPTKAAEGKHRRRNQRHRRPRVIRQLCRAAEVSVVGCRSGHRIIIAIDCGPDGPHTVRV